MEKQSNSLIDAHRVLLPMIRKLMPNLIANEIVGVQPMQRPRSLETGETYLPEKEVEYYWAQPSVVSIFTMKVEGMELSELKPIIEWCTETFGPVGESSGWLLSDGKFYFANEADRTLFVIRWQ